MIDYLEGIDHQIILAVNSLNSPFFDEVMWVISGKITWIPLYLILIYVGFKKFGKNKALLYVGCVILTIACTDFVCSGIIKNAVERYRPSHNLELTHLLHFYRFDNGDFYKGGQYGFVSSHAGNFFSLAWIVGLILKLEVKRILPILLGIATVISYSRLYLGVHYLSDIIGGFVVGTTIAHAIYYFLYRPLVEKYQLK